MDAQQASKWERTRRLGIVPFFIPRIVGIFLVISVLDYFIFGQNWDRLVDGLFENLIVATAAGILFGIIDWRANEKKYQEYRGEV